MNIGQLAEAAGITYPTALKWYHGRPVRLELHDGGTLAAICAALDVTPGDLLEYVPDEVAVTD